jgi:hypothetical protein
LSLTAFDHFRRDEGNMAETKYILVLANSARAGKHCVAGKIATRRSDGTFEIQRQWIRLTDPQNAERAVSDATTICPGHGPVRPLDIIKLEVRESCCNPNHPEDWYFEPSRRWEFVQREDKSCLPKIADNPATLWFDRIHFYSVGAGYVSQMKPESFSICLIQAPGDLDFVFQKKTVPDGDNPGQTKLKNVRDLKFTHAGRYHEFSVTDPEFMKHHDIWDRMQEAPQHLRLKDSANTFLCLSLGLEFRSRHYKICATIFEP